MAPPFVLEEPIRKKPKKLDFSLKSGESDSISRGEDMLKSLRWLTCTFLAAMCVYTWMPATAVAVEAPYFTWSAMQRFWNKQCPPGMTITNFSEMPGGYVVNLGRGVVLEAVISDLRVSGLRLRFDSRVELGGGPYFLLAAKALINIGGYGWPQQQLQEANNAFEYIFPQLRVYEWGATRFQREGKPSGMWEFSMEYLFRKWTTP